VRRICARALVAGLTAVAAAALAATPAGAASPLQVQLLSFNDFHGHLEPTTPGRIVPAPGAAPVPAGGLAYFATHVRQLEAENPRRSLLVSAGDLIGGSPLLSALFHDEPTVEAMNRLGVDVATVGNHEFDEGYAELRRMVQGGCHPVDGCQDGDGYEGAEFPYLAANVVDTATGRPILPPYVIKRFGRVKVAFVGVVLEGTPQIVSQSGIQGLEFRDEAESINRYIPRLRRKGVQAVVAVVHQGDFQTGTLNECQGLTGPLEDIVKRTSREVDVFLTGHTHTAYVCRIDDRLVTQASSFGRVITDVDLAIDRKTGEVTASKATNVPVTQDVAPAPEFAAWVKRYQDLAAPLANRPVGVLAGPATKQADDSGENAAGNLIADSQLAATTGNGAVAAFMNPGGVRADFPGGALTYGGIFTVQPFSNSLVTMTLTGAQLLELLKEQWCGQAEARILLPSASVHYAWSASAAAAILGKPCEGAANPVTDLRIGGTAVDPAASYRITVNSFLADGGDAFTVLRAGTDRAGGPVDLEALEAYLAPSLTGAPIAVPALNRIDVVP
jgi:5'-nucleotidase